jgi:hypothetical protein
MTPQVMPLNEQQEYSEELLMMVQNPQQIPRIPLGEVLAVSSSASFSFPQQAP